MYDNKMQSKELLPSFQDKVCNAFMSKDHQVGELKGKLDIFVHVTQIPSEFTKGKVTLWQQ